MSTWDEMKHAGEALLMALPAEQAHLARAPLSDEQLRRDWTYVPRRRAGLSLGDLGRGGRKAVHRLLSTALTPHAYAQAAAVMSLEDVLDRREGGARGRHSTDYWAMVFGDPGDDAWGWRFEGHHVSVNVTLADGRVAVSPCFLGANPAMVDHDGLAIVRPLGAEEELARALLAELGPAGRAAAVVADEAPWDIRSAAQPRIPAPTEPSGVSGAALPAAARALLDRLVGLYVDRIPADATAGRRPPVAELSFAWEGPPAVGAGHYYRIQGPGFLIEYDNVQNGANHVHSVCRFPLADFGDDILARHRADHAHASTDRPPASC
jgi:Protein of unknown function (DUF3500)